MNNYRDNRAHLDDLVAQAGHAVDVGAFNESVNYLAAAATFAWENYTGVFLDRRIESLLERVAQYVNEAFITKPQCKAQVGFLMTSIHPYGGHSKIAWRWMQLDQGHTFHLVLTGQKQYQMPDQTAELARTARVTCTAIPEGQAVLQRIRDARDQLAGAGVLVVNIHPNDVVGAVVIACLRETLRIAYIDHAFFSFSLGMSSAHAVCCTSPAAVAIATQERLVSPQHLVWYRNSPEWLGQDIPANGQALRARLDIPQNAPLLLSSGTEHKYYSAEGHGLIDLIAPVLDSAPDVHLVIVGIWRSDRFRGPLFERFAQRLHLLPPVSERELLQYIAACDIYLDSVPSHSGGAAQQAMLLHKPTLAYADPLTYRAHLAPQFFSVDDFSWIHFSGDSYRDDLQSLICDQVLRRERGSFLQAQVSSRIGEQDNLASIQAIYRKARQAPLVAETLMDESLRVDNPALRHVHDKISKSLDAYINPGPIEPPNASAQRTEIATRVIAFHLPQFHTIPENDTWWGPGFTEWTNVRAGQPLFEGHLQPFVPTELGYYDLSDVSVLANQARLARQHGIEGFCFHYYWFDGRRLLEKPVDQLLAHPEIDLPFCLCWANENWTRRWDGGEQDVLMHQSYAPELNQRFASDLATYFADPRYIRVQGRPVLLVYRTDVIPDLAATTTAWRAAWRELGVGEVYLVAVESFARIDPEAYGFDAAAEFPPHQVHAASQPPGEPLNLLADPDARVGDYRKLAHTWLARPRPPYKRFRGLLPGWDNSARRRRGGATMFVNASPDAYEDWLAQAVGHTLDEFEGDERLVFVNAWNEWGEGCTLEPDARWGRGYLEATRRVMQRPEQDLRALARKAAPPSDYEHWLALASTAPDDALAPALCAAGAGVALAVAVSGTDAVLQDATHASLATQLRPADLIAVSTNGALNGLAPALQASDWTLCLCAGDTLSPDALAQLTRALANAPASTLIAYLDHDERDAEGRLGSPFLKPAFNQELLLSCAYPGRALAVRTTWLQPRLALGESGFDLPFAYGLMLDALREAGTAGFLHVPVLALHLDATEPAVFATSSETWQALATRLANHAAQAEPGSQLLEGPLPGSFHLVPPLPRTPLVSIIIPTRDQLPFLSRCIESLLAKTAYPAFEVLVVDNDSETTEAREFLAGLETLAPDRIRVLRAPGPFNFSHMNNLAAREAQGEFLLLLNNDTAVLQGDWLTHLVRQGLRPGVGAVGARLLFPDGRIQHAGVVLGLCGPADHPLLGLPGDQPGYLGRAQLTQQFSAVTAACLLVPKALYSALGGLDEAQFGVSYNDVDLCLRIGATGQRIVWTPLATLLHEGSASQRAAVEGKTLQQKEARFSAEQAAFYARWPRAVADDPHYSPHLSLSERHYEIETRPALRPDPLRGLAPHHVAVFAADESGCGQYRVLQPLAALRTAGLCTGASSPELLPTNLLLRTGADVLVFQRPYTEVGLAALAAAKAAPGVRTIYEIDDHMAQVPVKSLHHQEMPKDLRGRILKGIGLCDRLVVSTEPLAQALGPHAAEVRVVPNRLPPRMWGDAPPVRAAVDGATRRKPRIGWAGGAGHLGDLEMIADVVRELADEVEWVFFGMCPPALRSSLGGYYAGVPTLDYPQHLMALTQSWDLAIAPLEINAFNECKSNLKLLEYGWCGVPVVCSDIAPYQGPLPATRVRNRYKDWVTALRERLADLPATQREGAALQQQVAQDWVLRGTALTDWYQAWTE